MTDYTLSVVQLCPGTYRDAANAVAEAAGYGPNNLSVKLKDAGGVIWWGCHAWWKPSVFFAIADYPPEVQEVLSHVVSSYGENLNPRDHWAEALNNAGLSVMEE